MSGLRASAKLGRSATREELASSSRAHYVVQAPLQAGGFGKGGELMQTVSSDHPDETMTLRAMASNLVVMASTLRVIASTLRAMTSKLVAVAMA